MGSLFASLDIGRKSLQAHQLALQVTSNNMSNINTPGYSRLHTVFETDLPVRNRRWPHWYRSDGEARSNRHGTSLSS